MSAARTKREARRDLVVATLRERGELLTPDLFELVRDDRLFRGLVGAYEVVQQADRDGVDAGLLDRRTAQGTHLYWPKTQGQAQ